MRGVWDFIQHNNAIPIGLFILFGGTGAVFASSPEAQRAVYSEYEEVQSVDNTYIVSADLATRDFALRIASVEEDEEYYYITYTYNTISIVDYVWREVEMSKDLKFSKKELIGRDLGLFLAEQLGQGMEAELAYLTEVQKQERAKGASLKRVATEYRGLVGRMFNPDEKTFPGYVPVVEENRGVESGPAAAALARLGESFIALPPIPNENDIKDIVAAAVAAALAQQDGTASTTPEGQEESVEDPVEEPVEDPPATTTPPVTTPPPATPPASTSTPPVPEPTPTPEPEPTPEPTPEPAPTPEPEPTPAPSLEPPAQSGSSTPQ